MASLALKQLIVPLGKAAGYLEARQLTQRLGGLPSHVLHDDYLVRTELWEGIRASSPMWAREIVVHPEKDGKFRRRKDVVGAVEDEQGRKWVFPARYVPEEAVGREKIGLFVDPEDVRVEKYRGRDAVIVHANPHLVVVLHGFLQENRGVGKVDETTRIPLKVPPGFLAELPKQEKRWLWRTNGANVGLLVRFVDDFQLRQFVYSNFRASNRLWVVLAIDLDVAQKLSELLALLPREQREALQRAAEARPH